MQIILLAAGTSSRMAPLSDKTLFKICWKTIIEHQVDTIISAWFNDFLIVCNKENIKHFKLIFSKKEKITFQYVIQKNLKNWMKWAIESCENKTKKNVFIVSSNDIVEKYIFEKMLKVSKKNVNYWLICGKIVDKYFPGGYISKGENWNLIDIVEKPGEWKEPSNQINLVLHIWNDFKDFQKKMSTFHNSTDDAYEKTIQYICQNWGEKIEIVEYNGFWQAVKYPWHINILTKYFLNNQSNKISSESNISKSAVLKGNGIVVEKWVKIFENVIIQWPTYIWENSIIWNNTLIRNSSIWENCVIWFWSEVCRSCLQNSIWTHLNYIWDSVLEENVSFWAWTTTWNLRLDEEEVLIEIKWEKIKTWTNKLWVFIWKNCRVWINVSINPWVKIGENSLIWAGIILWENLWENSFIYWKTEIIKKKNKKKVLKRV